MAQNPNDLVVTTGEYPAQIYRVVPKSVRVMALAAGATAIARFTAMAKNTATGLWVPAVQAGANGTGTISAFMDQNGAPRHATDETQANLIMEGEIHIDEIPFEAYGTLAELKAALTASGIRQKGFNIVGWPDFV